MNRRNFLTSLAVTTACAIPGVAALLARNSFERTLTAEAAKSRNVVLHTKGPITYTIGGHPGSFYFVTGPDDKIIRMESP